MTIRGRHPMHVNDPPKQPSKEVELYTDPHTWDEDRLDEWAASKQVTEAEGWLKLHNGPF